MDKVVILAFQKDKYLSLLQSSTYDYWAWKYSSTLGGGTINFSPNDCFETFPFPQNLSPEQEAKLEAIGETYHEHRRQLMLSLQIGLTKTYNLFHKKDLTVADVEKVSKNRESNPPSPPFSKGGIASTICEKGYHDILKLRELHVQMDNAVLSAYGWGLDPAQPDKEIDLKHDFYEVDYLPENDRIRFTISPEARREILKRLLQLNHQIHEQEVKAGLWEKRKVKKNKAGSGNNELLLFD